MDKKGPQLVRRYRRKIRRIEQKRRHHWFSGRLPNPFHHFILPVLLSL